MPDDIEIIADDDDRAVDDPTFIAEVQFTSVQIAGTCRIKMAFPLIGAGCTATIPRQDGTSIKIPTKGSAPIKRRDPGRPLASTASKYRVFP
jgi:hypothetical protein